MADKMRLLASNGEILARDNFVLACFGCRPFSEMATRVREVLELWLTLVPEQSLCWAVVGKSSTKVKKVMPRTLKRCFEMLDDDVTTTTDVYFQLFGPEPFGPDYQSIVKGYVKPKKIGFGDQTNLIEFLFPAEFSSQYGEDRFADLAASIFSTLRCDSGYAAPALCFGVRGQYAETKSFIAPLALQHQGYDVPNNASTAVFMGNRCRGARWLTMLSNALVDQIGGVDRLHRQVAQGVEIRELPQGVIIRAGAKSEIGAVNRGEKTPLLASVARAIEPITFFGDNSILPLFGNDEDMRDRWERRFWWNQD